VQHEAAPGTPEADAFYAMMDGYLGRMDALGVVIGLTADHGMSAKADATGRPQVLYLQQILDEVLGAGSTRVTLPIPDPCVVHHGALGAFATVFTTSGSGSGVRELLSALPGVEHVLPREEAARRDELPADRIGSWVVLGDHLTVLGTRATDHDLTALDAPLRSHGCLSEQKVPLLFNRPVQGIDPRRRLSNFDVFDMVLNHASAQS
jgi:phosphonoacetate hydrolase